MMRRYLFAFSLLAVALGAGRVLTGNQTDTKKQLQPPAPTSVKPVDFDRDIRPILSDTCFLCHGPDAKNRKGDVRLDTKAGAFAKAGKRAILVPGHPDQSELFLRITHADKSKQMPPAKHRKQLTPGQIELIKRWIEEGAKWEDHWAFVPPQRPALPPVQNKAWVKNAIDYFVLEKLEQEGLPPSSAASKEKLLRRVTLDLTGLPPTLAEIDAFVTDPSPLAYEKVVDRLLSSPRYGEHMALAWLDAARYSDSNGYQSDATRTMWPWRDWVIEALNANMPFDQFTIEQLAGDLLPNATVSQKIATGFNRNHMLNGEGGRHAEESRVEYVVDRVETTATVWLGLTMGCGRCHNHKYDPVSQKEFYQFYAYFNNIDESGGVDKGGNAKPVLELASEAQKAQRDKLNGELAALNQQLNKVAGAEAQSKWEQETIKQLDKDKKKVPDKIAAILHIKTEKRTDQEKKELTEYYRKTDPQAKAAQAPVDQKKKELADLSKNILEVMVMAERKDVRPTYLLKRGSWNDPDKSEPILPGLPSVLPGAAKSASSRLGLAQWLVDPGNPLTARVTVNRYWYHFFGTGLVKTLEDFGSQGERPSHPKLLDWLATEFVQSGWNVKHMHRLIVLSAAYQQSSKVTPELLQKDPHNRWLGRGPRQRLSSLAIRDQALALSGLLTEKVGGPPVKPYQPGDLWFDFSLGKIKYVQDKGPDLYRRSIYTFWRRSVGPTLFFDTPARQVCTVNLPRTNTPLHALTLMNDVTYVEAGRALAQQVLKKADIPAAQLALAFRSVTGRSATASEQKVLLGVYQKTLARYQSDPADALKLVKVGDSPRDESLPVAELAALTSVMNMLINLDEVITKE